MVKTLYNNIESCVTNNGHHSKFFLLERGVRQGCPLSPYLFVLIGQILNVYVKYKSNIEGIKLNGLDYTISQYADDTSLAVLCNKNNIDSCFKCLNKFEEVSGLKVNETKTEALPLGKGRIITCNKINWVKSTTKVLGIKIGVNKDIMVAENYNGILDKLRTKLNIWRQRNLSWLGKIHLIKSIGISQLIYLLTHLPSPREDFIKEAEK